MRTLPKALGLLASLTSISLLTTCGGNAPPKPAPDFSLAVSPGSLTLNAGTTSNAITVTATSLNSFSGTISVSIAGLPSGVTANPSTLTLTPAQPSATTTLTAAITAASASPTITFTGTSGTLTHTAALTLTVQAAPPDFSLAVSPGSLSLNAGTTSNAITVTATPLYSFTGSISVPISGLPSGVTASPSTLTLTPAQPSATTTLTAAITAASASPTITFTGTSGSLTHTATLALTVHAAPPDFSLAVSPTSLTLNAGTTSTAITVTATPLNSFNGSISVALTGLPAGVTANPSTLTLTSAQPSATTALTAAITAASASPTITFTGTSGSLTHTATLALTVQAASTTNAPDVTTWHYDLARTGLNSQETILTPANVNSTQFGRIGFFSVDGKVDAQPLFLANVVLNNAFHNILYVATEHASVYAFDADTGAQIWHVSALGSGESTSDNRSCSQITPEIGITSTPVIDRKSGPNGTLFTVAMSKDSTGAYHQRLHALDLATGTELSGSPTEISATYPGTGDNSQNGNVVFDPGQYAERAALLLLNGTIYLTWTSHCDIGLYTGWIMAYSESTLQQTAVLNITPNGHAGSVWMAGAGMAADSNGFIYLLDANGTFDTTLDANGFPSRHNFGNAMLKLSTANGKLTVADYFESSNGTDDSDHDLDLGSAGALLLPDQTDASGVVHHLIVGAGKDQIIYVADRDNLGKYNPSSTSNIYQQLSGAVTGMIYGSPAYFNGVLYYAADGDSLKSFPITNAHIATSASSATAVRFQHPSATPTISANGTQNGIVWALEANTSSPAVLHAYDPADLTHEFYNSNQAPSSRDSFGNGNKFIAPLVVNGKVYIGTQNGVSVFGLLPH